MSASPTPARADRRELVRRGPRGRLAADQTETSGRRAGRGSARRRPGADPRAAREPRARRRWSRPRARPRPRDPGLSRRVRPRPGDRGARAEDTGEALAQLETDDAVEILADLDEASSRRSWPRCRCPSGPPIEQGLAFPEWSAGRLMQREVVAVPDYWTVGQTIDYLRAKPDLPDDFYDIFLVDPRFRSSATCRSAGSCAAGGRCRWSSSYQGAAHSSRPRPTRRRWRACSAATPWSPPGGRRATAGCWA